MSCLAMVALTQLFHLWIRAVEVPLQPVSYVDNWAILMTNPEHMSRACAALDKFVALLHVDLDAKKCYTWAADRSSRTYLRGAGFRVVNATRDLGAHVVYSCQLSNATTMQRFRDLEDFWPKLLRATCTVRQKCTLIQMVAWPRALHAVSAVVVGKKHFTRLRTSAMQALGLSKPGACPYLHCCLESCSFDPLVFAALDTLRDARSLGVPADVALGLETGPLCAGSTAFNSVSEILCQRLHQTGFEVLDGGFARDSVGDFHFLQCGFGELRFRLQLSWLCVVAARVHHRSDFRGFGSVDVFHTRRAYHQADGFDQGVLRKHLHGAHVTND